MYNKIFRYVLMFVVISSIYFPVFSQKNSFAVSPLKPLLFKKAHFQYERFLNKDVSSVIQFESTFRGYKPDFYASFFPSDTDLPEWKMDGISLNLGIRIYRLAKELWSSARYSYFGVYGFISKKNYGHRTWNFDDVREEVIAREGMTKAFSYGNRMELGFKRIYDSGFFLDYSLFGGYSWFSKKGKEFLMIDQKGIEQSEEKKLKNDLYSGLLFTIGYKF